MNKVFTAVRNFYRREPARVVAAVVAAIVFVAQWLDVGIDSNTVFVVVGTALAVLFGGEIVRKDVKPVKKQIKRKAKPKKA
jgi:hypothetical protein